MVRVKPAASLASLLVLAMLLAGCFGGLAGIAPNPGGPSGPDIGSPPPFPGDDVRDEDLAAHLPGEILVGVESEDVAYRIAERLGAAVTGYLEPIGLAKLELNDKSRSLTDAMRPLKGEPGVRYAQANFVNYVLPMASVEASRAGTVSYDVGSDDFAFMDDPNSDYNKYQYGLRLIRADAAWFEGLTGEGTVVAIIDTGVQSDHPFLAGKVLEGYNPDEPGTGTDDFNGHGTHVAGIAAGMVHAGRGFAGVAPDAKILPIRVFNDARASNWAVAMGLLIAADPSLVGLTSPKADVANMSLGGPVYSLAVQDAVNFALDRDVVVVVAMGNSENQAVRYPAAYPGVIAVGASDAHDDKVDFSTTGPHLSVMAPGHRVFSAYRNTSIAWASGTSMAAPHVAGAALLLRQKYPDASPGKIKELLERTADFKAGYTFREYGHGRINLARALAADLDGRPRGGIELFVYTDGGWGVLGADVTLWRGDKVVKNIRTGGFWDVPSIYHGLAFFYDLDPGDDYWIEIRLDDPVEHGQFRSYRIDNVSVQADDVTYVRLNID